MGRATWASSGFRLCDHCGRGIRSIDDAVVYVENGSLFCSIECRVRYADALDRHR